jgi:DNA-binding MarR family transcriptional regulator
LREVVLFLDDGDHRFLARFGLSYQQYAVLRQLQLATFADHAPTISQLAARVLNHKSSVSRMVDRLESADLVRSFRDPADDRIVRVVLTPRGDERKRVVDKAFRAFIRQRLASLERAQREGLGLTLGQLAVELQRELRGNGFQPDHSGIERGIVSS